MMVEKKNVCITITSLAPGGAEKQALLLAKALQANHNPIIVILKPKPAYNGHLSVIKKEKLNHVFLATNPIRKVIEFSRLLRHRKIEIIFSFLPADTIWGAVCGKVSGVPYIFGGIRNSHIPFLKFTALKMVNNHVLNYTIANNFSAYEFAMKFGLKDKLMVIFNGIEIRPLLKREIVKNKIISIISVGRLVKQKDYTTALKAIVELKERLGGNYEINYKIVGSGPEHETIVSTIENYGLEREVTLITDSSNIYDLLDSSDIYLCTSIFEGISNSIMEAMNCALPIVATDAGDNSRLVQNGKNGYLTALYDHKNISEHLFSLFNMPSLREQMGLRSYEYLVESFSYEMFQKKYLGILNNITDLKVEKGELILPEENAF